MEYTRQQTGTNKSAMTPTNENQQVSHDKVV